MGKIQRSIKRKHNLRNSKCPRCGDMLVDHSCTICGWMKKSFFKDQRNVNKL